MRQTSFHFLKDYKNEFGGSLILGRRKSKRPLSTKNPIHLVLKSSGSSHFNPGNRKMEMLVRNQAKKYGIKIYDIALSWSHIHMLVLLPSREAYLSFIRTVTALLARLITQGKKVRSEDQSPTSENKLTKKIFDLRPYTRIISWGKQFKRVLTYHTQNTLEALGLQIRKKPIKSPPPRKPPLPKNTRTGGQEARP